MEKLPYYVYLVFGLTLLLALVLFAAAMPTASRFWLLAWAWVGGQSALAAAHFYENFTGFPPRLPLLLLPPLAANVTLFATRRGRRFLDELALPALTLLHTVRLPVELVLYWLFLHHAVPRLLTFEGRNFDVFSGLSAPVVFYFSFVRRQLSRPVLLAWNLLCLALVLNAAVSGVLSAPTPLQRFGFGQPNVAVLHFPFVLLPAVLVPLVLLAHLASIRQLWLRKSQPASLS